MWDLVKNNSPSLTNKWLDYARVLVGFQVPLEEWGDFQEFLLRLNYPCMEETDNEVYVDFLRSNDP